MMSIFFKKTIPLFFALLAIISACDNASKKPAPPSVSDTQAAQKGFYKHLKGTIGAYPVTMDLVKNALSNDRQGSEPWVGFGGYYYYDKYQEPIALYGSLDSTGTIVLEEWALEGKSAQIRGNLTPEGAFIGTWEDSAKTQTLNVVLKEVYADSAIALENFEYGDSFRLFDKLKNSPVAQFVLDVLLPTPNTEGGSAAFLKNEILNGISQQSTFEPILTQKDYRNTPLAEVQKAQRDSFFADYRETMKEEKPDSSKDYVSENYSKNSEMMVVFNEKGLLSLSYSGYSFTGGAHGNYGTILATYDLKAKKQVVLSDIFRPKYQKTLSTALEKALRKKYKLNAKEPLNGFLFENTIQATNNFALTHKGILFNYPPYDIAAYAVGEIQLYVPFEEINAVLLVNF
jgi:hypothetical protein